jgi:hypothetical protein
VSHRAYPFLILVLLVALSSCKISQQPPYAVPGETVNTEAAPVLSERDRILQEILDYQKRTGEDLESLAAQLRGGETGALPLEQDLDVAQGLLSSAQSAAGSHSQATLAVLLSRLDAALSSVQGDLPAAAVARACERALSASQRYSGQEAKTQMSGLLLAARNVCQNSPYATLVPSVDAALKSAKEDVDAGRLDGALPKIQQALEGASEHRSLAILADCRMAVEGAGQAASRQAWIVAKAQLEQLDSDLRQLVAEVKPPASPAPAAESSTGAATPPAASSAGQPLATSEPGQSSAAPAQP